MTLKPGLGSLMVIENYAIQSGTHDFLLMFHSNHRPIRTVSEINCDIRRKSHENRQFFPPRVFNASLKGFPVALYTGAGVSRNQNDGAFRWSKKFSDRFSRFDTIPACDRQPASHPTSQTRCRSKYRAYCVAPVKQEAQLMLTTGSTRLAVSRGQQEWYHFGSIATFR